MWTKRKIREKNTTLLLLLRHVVPNAMEFITGPDHEIISSLLDLHMSLMLELKKEERKHFGWGK